ncbi:phage holin family protein [Nicoliella spurrieriana]|uniref:Phage holin family protein n=1 Tax=Nicoliella spurrieriana TaxID=2925830 RepID=A0A976RSI4_9LACO|nr:phage holin family protein [Nicoliella spurrieriana]UQS86981.1 phage holin family protein [Nicoliella spurrieriana]
MHFLKQILLNMLVFIAVAGFLQSSGIFYVASITAALGAALVLSILNALVKPFITVLSLPINILTLGLFSIVINGLMLEMTSWLVGNESFHFSSFGSAMLVAIILSLCNAIFADHYQRQNQ